MVVAAELAGDIGEERQIMPAALALECGQTLERRPRHDGERDALLNVRHFAVPRRQQRRAHRARPLALRADHIVVDDKRVLGAEQVGERRRPLLSLEGIVLLDLAAGWQAAALFGDALDMAAQLDLLDQQRLAGAAIFGTLVGKTHAAGFRQLSGGFQGGTVHVMTSLSTVATRPMEDDPGAANPTGEREIFFVPVRTRLYCSSGGGELLSTSPLAPSSRSSASGSI